MLCELLQSSAEEGSVKKDPDKLAAAKYERVLGNEE